ncbi:Putative LOC100902024 [Caligus rogercresseyi]|uniref:LOC100902024 n=1 Tax=Caligus rogercresseyi TaxID=217165 RepID=A0A7T8H0M5_CALRO|nr:Putative LOC100902024 [Caligus rogercresseyi]
MEKESKVNMNMVKEWLKDQRHLWALDGRFKDRPFLLDLLDIHAVNNKNIQQAVTGTLFKVFGEDFGYNSLHLLVTDGATYCLKAG